MNTGTHVKLSCHLAHVYKTDGKIHHVSWVVMHYFDWAMASTANCQRLPAGLLGVLAARTALRARKSQGGESWLVDGSRCHIFRFSRVQVNVALEDIHINRNRLLLDSWFRMFLSRFIHLSTMKILKQSGIQETRWHVFKR